MAEFLPVVLVVGILIGFWLRAKLTSYNIEYAHARRRPRTHWHCPWCGLDNVLSEDTCPCGWVRWEAPS